VPASTRIVPSGSVQVRLPGSSRYVPISSVKSVPFGTTIDATNGQVKIDILTPTGRVTGTLSGGEFVLTISKSGGAVATLTGGNFTACTHAAGRAASVTAAATAQRSSKVVRKLWSNVKGNFSVDGRYAATTVEGTHWLTEDRCDGTYVFVAFGAVRVTGTVTHKSQLVQAGRSLLVQS
jgi:hypothetical protein